MAEASEQYLLLVLPLIVQMLGGEEAPDLLESAQELWARDPERFGRLVAVSARLELIDRLRAERIVRGQVAYPERQWREIDQLAAYLAVTCIPMTEGNAGRQGQHFFEQFVEALPDSLQRWLAERYVLLPGEMESRGLAQWVDLDYREKCHRVAEHFSRMAERYPGIVDYMPWDEHDRLHLSQWLREAPYEFTALHSQGDLLLPVEVTVGVPTGVAESEIIRFLLIARLRSWLARVDDPSLVERYWARRQLHYRRLRLLAELEDNLRHIDAWCANSLHQRPTLADYAPLTGLAENAVRNVLEDPEALQRFGGVDLDSLHTYLSGVGHINALVREFNERYEEPSFDAQGKAEGEATLFEAIAQAPETRELVICMEAIHRELSRSAYLHA